MGFLFDVSDSVNYNIVLVPKGWILWPSISTSLILKYNQLTIPVFLTCCPKQCVNIPSEWDSKLPLNLCYFIFLQRLCRPFWYIKPFFFTFINYRRISVFIYFLWKADCKLTNSLWSARTTKGCPTSANSFWEQGVQM